MLLKPKLRAITYLQEHVCDWCFGCRLDQHRDVPKNGNN